MLTCSRSQRWAKCICRLEAQLLLPPQLQKLLFHFLFQNGRSCIQKFVRLIAQFYKLNLTLFYFDCNIHKCLPFSANYLLFFLSKLTKNAVFALYYKISIAEVGLRFNLVWKCCSAIAQLHCTLNESKSLLWKLLCASEIKKIKLRFLHRAFTGWKYCCTLLRCAFDIMLFVPISTESTEVKKNWFEVWKTFITDGWSERQSVSQIFLKFTP